MTMDRPHDARAGAHGTHKRRRHAMRTVVIWAAALCAGILLRDGTAASTTTRVMTAEQFVPSPVLEIVYPPNGHLHATSEMTIEITLRTETLHAVRPGTIRHVCVGMATVLVLDDAVLADDATRPQERCYEVRDEPSTAYEVTGLLPGARYAVSAGLIDDGKVVGLSMRTFEVATVMWNANTDKVELMGVPDAMRFAHDLHVDNDRGSATAIYRAVIKFFPTHFDALHRLGQAEYQDGQTERAVELIRRALDVQPSDASAHVSLALCFKALGRTEDAISEFRRALELRPSYVHAALGLGLLLQAQEKWDEALHEFRKVASTASELPVDPRQRPILEPPLEQMILEALAWVCEILRLSDGLYEAERCLSQATKRFPSEVRFHIDRGHLLLYGGQFESAQREYEVASQLGSVHAMTHAADVLEAMGDYEGSIRRYQDVLESPHSRSSTVYNQVAIMMTTVLPRILPGSQDAIDRERDRFRNNVAGIISSTSEEMNAVFIDPSRVAFSTGITMNSHHRNNRELKQMLGKMYHGLWIDPGLVREEYVNSYGVTPIPYHQQFTHDPPKPHGRLRVGFVSRFFYNAAVGLFMNELLPQLNATKYEVFAFGVGLSTSVKGYDQVPQIAEHVIALPRNLLVLGMDKTTYFASFSRLAPIQAAWWGNPETSGVPTIDYYLTSEHEHKDVRDHYTETVFPMKGLGIYHALPPLPNSTVTRDDIRRTVQERFNLASDFRFYLSIESILHFHPDFDDALGRIFDRDPLAHVFLLASSNRKSWRQQLIMRIEARLGTAFARRVWFFMDVDHRQELLLLGAADAVLGSLYLTRAKAAMQAFTAGVPVVTLAGELWATRITAALYKQMGVRGLITTTLDEYADLAVRLATDASFRERMVRKIHRNRDRLSRDRTAVAEWERFFDVAAARLRGGGGGESDRERDERDERDAAADSTPVSNTQDVPQRKAEAARTCPATSLLLHLL